MDWRHIVKVGEVRRGSSIPAILGRSQRMVGFDLRWTGDNTARCEQGRRRRLVKGYVQGSRPRLFTCHGRGLIGGFLTGSLWQIGMQQHGRRQRPLGLIEHPHKRRRQTVQQ